MNVNVKLTLCFTMLLSVSSSLLFDNPFAQLTYLLRNDNTSVGLASGVKGLVQLLMALPAGALADRFGRQRLLRAAAIVMAICSSYTAFVLIHLRPRVSDSSFFYFLTSAACVWGVFMGIHSAPLAALFGDSVASGNRSRVYVWRQSLRTLGAALGPATSVLCHMIPPHPGPTPTTPAYAHVCLLSHALVTAACSLLMAACSQAWS